MGSTVTLEDVIPTVPQELFLMPQNRSALHATLHVEPVLCTQVDAPVAKLIMALFTRERV